MKKALRITGTFLLWFFGIIAALFIISTITHNILTPMEKNKNKIGQTINIDGKNMQAYVTGQGEKTIVLLSGLGTSSPIIDFMPLAERLSKNYKVVILESFGYGFSDTTKKERSNENMVGEIRSALHKLELNGPYILMPHSISGIYSLYYAVNYPNEVEAIIGIDDSIPNQTKNNKDAEMPSSLTLLNKLGIIRDITYLLPSADDGINKNNYYTAEQMEIRKMATAWNSTNISIINEANMVNKNTEALYNVKYPKDLPVMVFLAKESVDAENDWTSLHEDLITNPEIQKIETLNGGHYLHWSNADKIAEITKEFLDSNLK